MQKLFKNMTYRTLARFFGILLIFGILLLDVFKVGSPGIGPLQWMVISFGILIIAGTFMSANVKSGLPISLATIFIMFLLFEGMLILAGFDADYTLALLREAQQEHERLPFWLCDADSGCRFLANQIPDDYCEEPYSLSERICLTNSQGYVDTDEFIPSADLENADYRILALGDSFTYGASADVGNGYIDILERELQTDLEIQVWNAGIPGTGTVQAVHLAGEYVPLMQAEIVILGFFLGNDFNDNLYPIDMYERIILEDDINNAPYVYAYDIYDRENPVRLSDDNIYFRANKKPVANNQIERWLRLTRVGSLLLNARYSLSAVSDDIRLQEAIEQTRNYLNQLNQVVENHDADLLILLIPTLDDFNLLSQEYIALQNIAEELEIPTLEVFDVLEPGDYNPHPDGHWNNTGHEKVGGELVHCIETWIETDLFCDESS